MKERPILFSGPMVRAILKGRKTQTRRVVPEKLVDAYYEYDEYCNSVMPCGADFPCSRSYERDFFLSRSPYVPGDRLYVRESFRAWCCNDDTLNKGRFFVRYAADFVFRAVNVFFDHNGAGNGIWHEPHRWYPSIHMPRWASRLTLEITGVRVERLQDISREDAISEGINCPATLDEPCKRCGACLDSDASLPIIAQCNPRSAFANLWQSINGKHPGRTWDDNPWVYVVEFQRIQ